MPSAIKILQNCFGNRNCGRHKFPPFCVISWSRFRSRWSPLGRLSFLLPVTTVQPKTNCDRRCLCTSVKFIRLPAPSRPVPWWPPIRAHTGCAGRWPWTATPARKVICSCARSSPTTGSCRACRTQRRCRRHRTKNACRWWPPAARLSRQSSCRWPGIT